MTSNRGSKSSKTEKSLLLDVARTIGSTLGTLVAKTSGELKRSRPTARRVPAKKRRKKISKSRKRRDA